MESYLSYLNIAANGIKMTNDLGLGWLFGKQNKSQILDPYSTIIRLAINTYKPIGTKIDISNNKLYLQNPSAFQGGLRFLNGSHKNDIQYLIEPIKYACDVLIDKKKNASNLQVGIINQLNIMTWIFIKAKHGLANLRTTYDEHPMVIHYINMYIKIIDDAIKFSQPTVSNSGMNDMNSSSEIDSEDQYEHDSNYSNYSNYSNPKYDLNNESEYDKDMNEIIKSDIDSTKNENAKIRMELYDEFVSMWSDNQISVIYGSLVELDKTCAKNTSDIETVKHNLINSIEYSLSVIDMKIQKVISSIAAR